MIETIAKRCADRLATERGAPENRDVYVYGIECAISQLLMLLGIAVIGILFGRVGAAVIWCASLMALRMPLGGYHADTHRRCQVISFVICAAAMAIHPWVTPVVAVAACVLSVAIALALAPVIHPNQPLSAQRQRLMRRWALGIAAAELAGVSALALFGGTAATSVAGAIALGGVSASLSALYAWIGAKVRAKSQVMADE